MFGMSQKFPPEKMPSALRQHLEIYANEAILALVRAGYAPERGIHDCRKSLKQIRTLLRLLRPALGDVARQAGRFCAEVSRQLSASRDHQVMLDTCAALMTDPAIGDAEARALQAVRDWLLVHAEKVGTPDFSGMDQALSRWRDEMVPACPVDKGGTLYLSGLARFARQTGKSWRQACDEEPAVSDAFHAGRKAAKNWMYALRLSQPVWRRAEKRLHRQLQGWTETLGQVNDLEVLHGWIQQASGLAPYEQSLAALWVHQVQGQKMQQARQQARSILP